MSITSYPAFAISQNTLSESIQPQRPLCYYGNPVLRNPCFLVEAIDNKIHALVENMIQMIKATGGIGIAANQIGESLRIFVIKPATTDDIENPIWSNEMGAYINPVITRYSKETNELFEECLSIPLPLDYNEQLKQIKITRPAEIDIMSMNLQGEIMEEKNVHGWKSRQIQHEYDHLEGIFYTDRITSSETAKLQALQSILLDISEKNLINKDYPFKNEGIETIHSLLQDITEKTHPKTQK